MQQAVWVHFRDAQAIYRFTHRDKDVYFQRQVYNQFLESICRFGELGLTEKEREWLQTKCSFFAPEYIDYLSTYRFKPEQVHVTFTPKSDDDNLGRIDIEAVGPWVETILWEVPLMATLSELYFAIGDTDWSYDGQEALAHDKAKQLLEAGCVFSEFGTRRRRSFRCQDLVVATILQSEKQLPEAKGKVMGTSNVYLAYKYDTAPIGTIAHEWFMGVGALQGYENVNGKALDLWEQVYPNVLLLALTDTFSTEAFYKDFIKSPDRARRWRGLRQDSGNPYLFAPRAKEIYHSMGIDHREKNIIFSDSVNLEKALQLKKQCDELGFMSSFGIGTYLTNDFVSVSDKNKKSKALNMVIKLAGVNGKHCVKISDELTKNTGDPETVKYAKKVFGINA